MKEVYEHDVSLGVTDKCSKQRISNRLLGVHFAFGRSKNCSSQTNLISLDPSSCIQGMVDTKQSAISLPFHAFPYFLATQFL